MHKLIYCVFPSQEIRDTSCYFVLNMLSLIPFPVLPAPPSWFPGHMNRFTKQLPALLSRTDVVLELRDARLPLTSINHNLESESHASFLPFNWTLSPPVESKKWTFHHMFNDPPTLPYITLVSTSWLVA